MIGMENMDMKDMGQYLRSFSTDFHVRLRGTGSVSPSRQNSEPLKPLRYNPMPLLDIEMEEAE